jgi:hypothetical protein
MSDSKRVDLVYLNARNVLFLLDSKISKSSLSRCLLVGDSQVQINANT